MSLKKNKKILFIIDNLGTGGAQRQLANLSTGLKQRNCSIEVFCYSSEKNLAKELIDEGIKIHWYKKKSRYSFSIIKHLRKVIIKGLYDIIISFLTTPNFYNIITNKLFGLNDTPIIISERFCDLPSGISKIENFIRFFYRFADHIVINSHHQRINFEKKYPHLKKSMSTIYNGYDLSDFSPGNKTYLNETLRILVIASISPYKNGLCLIEALNIIKKNSAMNFKISWIGQIIMKGERLKYFKMMEKKITEYKLNDNWKWLGQRNDIVEQIRSHDLLVHCSFGEGLPNVVAESLCCGLPVIISDALDHSVLIQDKKSGLLFDWKNPNDLAQKITCFANLTRNERKIMGCYGRKFAVSYLSKERLVSDYEKLINKLLNRQE